MWMQTIRRGLIGAVAGALASTFLITTFPTLLPALFLVSVFGAAIALLLDGRRAGRASLVVGNVIICNHVIKMFERAEIEPDAARRKQCLTFVIVGVGVGVGFSGAKLAGGLDDFACGILAVIAISPSEHILPELSDVLAAYALAGMRARGSVHAQYARGRCRAQSVMVTPTAEGRGSRTLQSLWRGALGSLLGGLLFSSSIMRRSRTDRSAEHSRYRVTWLGCPAQLFTSAFVRGMRAACHWRRTRWQ